MNLAVLAVAALALLCALAGYKRGLIKSVLGAVGIVVSILLTNLLCPYVHDFLYTHTSLDESVRQYVETALRIDELEDEVSVYDQENFLESVEIPEIIKNYIRSGSSGIQEDINGRVQSYAEYVVSYLTDMVINGLACIITFALIRLLIIVVLSLADFLHGIPIIGGIDKVGSVAFGLVRALLIVWCLMMVLTFLSAFTWASQLVKMIDESSVLSFIYDRNIFLSILNGILSTIQV